jgi:hypothetical protein
MLQRVDAITGGLAVSSCSDVADNRPGTPPDGAETFLHLNLVMRNGRLAVEQVFVVPGVENSGGNVVSGKGANILERVPETEGHYLGPLVAKIAGEKMRSAVSRGPFVLRDPVSVT